MQVFEVLEEEIEDFEKQFSVFNKKDEQATRADEDNDVNVMT